MDAIGVCLLARAASLPLLEDFGFMAFAKPNTNLNSLLNQWKSLLQQWAKGGSLATAAQEALLLSGIPEGLQILINEWAAADFKSLPEIELLSGVDISGAMGAYAISTGKIYLNETWLENATNADIFAVLTEELGHHLDAVLNKKDTPGDEGQLFAAALLNKPLSKEEINAINNEEDSRLLLIDGQVVSVEQQSVYATRLLSTSVGEDGTITLEIYLTTAPAFNVTATIAFGPEWASANSSSSGSTQLVFTPSNFNTGQRVVLQPLDNLTIIGDRAQTFSLTFSSTDSTFNNLTVVLRAQSGGRNKLIIRNLLYIK